MEIFRRWTVKHTKAFAGTGQIHVGNPAYPGSDKSNRFGLQYSVLGGSQLVLLTRNKHNGNRKKNKEERKTSYRIEREQTTS